MKQRSSLASKKPLFLPQEIITLIGVINMITNNITTTQEQQIEGSLLSLKRKIREAAEILKEEIPDVEVPLETEAIALIIYEWLEEKLEDMDWNYQHSSTLQNAIFKLALEEERKQDHYQN